MFRTVIGYTYKKEGVNFGGHYCFVQWGCGSPCKQSAVVDVKNGNVYDGPPSSLGYDYEINSRMVIVNPPDDTTGLFSKKGGYYDADCAYCEPEIWIWDERNKMFKEYNWKKE